MAPTPPPVRNGKILLERSFTCPRALADGSYLIQTREKTLEFNPTAFIPALSQYP